MDLIIDAGNTQIKLGYFSNRKLKGLDLIPSELPGGIYKYIGGKDFDNIMMGSVIDLPLHLMKYLKDKSKHFLYFDENTPLPIKVTYQKKTGSDRIAQVTEANNLYPKEDILVISTGTCITYNFINAKGVYSGGAISPGLQMRFKALHRFTRRLPLIALEEIFALVGKNTKESILSGVLNGMVYEIEGFISSYNEKYPRLRCILCGGDSRYIGDKLKTKVEIVPDLGIYGLHTILKFNVKNKG